MRQLVSAFEPGCSVQEIILRGRTQEEADLMAQGAGEDVVPAGCRVEGELSML